MSSKEIEGWFDFDAIYDRIVSRLEKSNIERPVIVEVGCYKGKSSRYMATLVKKYLRRGQFYCVDTWSTEPAPNIKPATLKEFLDNMTEAGVDKYVLPVESTSFRAAGMFPAGSVHAVFIDASHLYENVKTDLKMWYRTLSREAVFFGGHDIYWGEVRLAVDQFCATHGLKYKIENNSWYIEL